MPLERLLATPRVGASISVSGSTAGDDLIAQALQRSESEAKADRANALAIKGASALAAESKAIDELSQQFESQPEQLAIQLRKFGDEHFSDLERFDRGMAAQRRAQFEIAASTAVRQARNNQRALLADEAAGATQAHLTEIEAQRARMAPGLLSDDPMIRAGAERDLAARRSALEGLLSQQVGGQPVFKAAVREKVLHEFDVGTVRDGLMGWFRGQPDKVEALASFREGKIKIAGMDALSTLSETERVSIESQMFAEMGRENTLKAQAEALLNAAREKSQKLNESAAYVALFEGRGPHPIDMLLSERAGTVSPGSSKLYAKAFDAFVHRGGVAIDNPRIVGAIESGIVANEDMAETIIEAFDSGYMTPDTAKSLLGKNESGRKTFEDRLRSDLSSSLDFVGPMVTLLGMDALNESQLKSFARSDFDELIGKGEDPRQAFETVRQRYLRFVNQAAANTGDLPLPAGAVMLPGTGADASGGTTGRVDIRATEEALIKMQQADPARMSDERLRYERDILQVWKHLNEVR